MKKFLQFITTPVAAISISVLLLGLLVFAGMSILNIMNFPKKDNSQLDATDEIIKVFEKNFNKLEHNVYKSQDFTLLGLHRDGTFDNYMSSTPRLLSQINSNWPINNLNKTNNPLIYTTYTIETDSGQSYKMFLFFSPMGSEHDDPPKSMDQWTLTGQVFFINKKLSFSEFSSVKTGSTYEEVVAIDPVASLQKPPDSPLTYTHQKYDQVLGKYVEEVLEIPPALEFKTYHYLTDGILCFSFNRESADDMFKVSSIDFNSTFDIAVDNTIFSLRINNEDYPT